MYLARARQLLVIVGLVAASCSSSPDDPERAADRPTPPIVTEAREDLLLSWFADGGAATASSVSEVPEEARAEVRVQDPTIPPERRDPSWIFLADLRRPDQDGRYPVRALPRTEYEAARREAQATEELIKAQQAAETPGKPLEIVPQPDGAGSGVIMYANRHCPVCQKARRWLLDQKIPYVEKDIQKDRAAAAELMSKGKAQGIPVSGVPVFDVGGKLIPGFDKAAIRKAIAATKPMAGTQGII
jgi:glutaredoxin